MKLTQLPFRKLRGYAFDALLSKQSATADINSVIYRINWESLEPGPIGEYVEVIDFDPTIKKFYEPVDLGDPFLLAQDGLAPSESNPQFHQQMVYAVAMTTIQYFEQALGRAFKGGVRAYFRHKLSIVSSDPFRPSTGRPLLYLGGLRLMSLAVKEIF